MKIVVLSAAHPHVFSYVSALQQMADVEVIGIADADQERGQTAATQCRLPLFESYAQALTAAPDAAVVCAENSRHRELVEMAAQAGVHVLCEKPLATSVADALAMITACAQAGVMLMTAFPMRFSAPLCEIQQQLAAGAFGQVYCGVTTNQGSLPLGADSWFVDPALAGGGALMDHVVHVADILRWYLQEEVVEVYAQANRLIHGDAVQVETGGQLMLTFASGIFATIDCSWSRPAAYPTWGGLTLTLSTERGVVVVDAFRQVLQQYGQQQASWRFWGSDADRGMLEAFVTAIREGHPPAVSVVDGLRAVEVVAAAYASLASGQPVQLELSPLPASQPRQRAE